LTNIQGYVIVNHKIKKEVEKMILRIITDCAFAGCENTHFVKVNDDATEEEINEIANEYMMNDIEPSYSWGVASEEEADEEGYDIE
jgi:hypothetical protein